MNLCAIDLLTLAHELELLELAKWRMFVKIIVFIGMELAAK